MFCFVIKFVFDCLFLLKTTTATKSVSWKSGEEMISQTSQSSAEKVHTLVSIHKIIHPKASSPLFQMKWRYVLFFLAVPAPQLSWSSSLRDLRSAWTVSCSGPAWWRQPSRHVGCPQAAGGGRWGRSAEASLEDLQDQANTEVHDLENAQTPGGIQSVPTIILKNHFPLVFVKTTIFETGSGNQILQFHPKMNIIGKDTW